MAGQQTMKVYGGFFLLLVAFALTIASLATMEWMKYTSDDGSTSVGLIQTRSCNSKGDSCTTSDVCDSSYLSTQCNVGKQTLGIGIASLVCAVVGVIFVFVGHKKSAPRWRLAAVLSWLSAALLCMVSVFLYSKKTVNLDWGFILYLFASFFSLIGTIVVIHGPGVAQPIS